MLDKQFYIEYNEENVKRRRSDMAEEMKNENEEMINVINLTDDDGNECEFELIGYIELDGQKYVGLIPMEDNDNGEYLLLRVTGDNEEEATFEVIEDDDEFERAVAAFEDEYMDELDLDS